MKRTNSVKAVAALAVIISFLFTTGMILDAKERIIPTNCQHENLRESVVKSASEETNGIVNVYCMDCLTLIESKEIHAYKSYEVEIEHGQNVMVWGWLESEYDNTSNDYLDENGFSYAVLSGLNQYRMENGIDTLTWNSRLQNLANKRAIEAGYSFSHSRPNGEEWYTVDEYLLGGENLAKGYTTPERVLAGWKKSKTHNENLLQNKFKSIAVGVFHMYSFDGNSVIPNEKVIWAQSFSYKNAE